MRYFVFLLLVTGQCFLPSTMFAVEQLNSRVDGQLYAQPSEVKCEAVERLQSQMRQKNILQNGPLFSSVEPDGGQRVEPISWLRASGQEGDGGEKAVESASRGPSYLRYVVPVAIILSAGTATYLLYSVRSR